jgi:hypothetical protein
MLLTAEDVERWLTGSIEEALQLERPANDNAIVIGRDRKAS